MGIVVQPSFIVAQVYVITGRSPKRKRSFLDPRYSYIIIFASPTLISVVRFVAIKHTYRCTTFFTARSLTLVGLGMFANLHFLVDRLKRTIRVFRASFTFINVPVMIYCHISVYFVSRRHENRIRSEQVSPQAASNFVKLRRQPELYWPYFCVLVCTIFVGISSNSSKYIVTHVWDVLLL